MLAAIVEPGKIFAEKYRVEGILGSGGMGIILAARHAQLEHRVAIKVMSEVSEDAERLARFTREAKASARIQSDHVVRILDFGTEGHGLPFIVMEHLSGQDLGHFVHEGGPLDVEEAIDFILQACEGVAEAHQHGIVHRDIKPANLFLTRTKSGALVVKVLDFGASKLTGKTSLATGDPLKTDAFAVIGSPSYMAPEQLREGMEIDGRVDVYALGATLFELVAGRPLFSADSISRIFSKVLWDPPPTIRSVRPDAPELLEKILLKCLEKTPSDRYQSVMEFAEALGALAPLRSRALLEQIALTGHAAPSVIPARPLARASSPRLEGAIPAFPANPPTRERTEPGLAPPSTPPPQELTPTPIVTPGPLATPTLSAEPTSTPAAATSLETPLAVTSTPLPLPPIATPGVRPPVASDPGDMHVPVGNGTRLGILLGAGVAALLVVALGVTLARSGKSEDTATTATAIPPTAAPTVSTPDLPSAHALEQVAPTPSVVDDTPKTVAPVVAKPAPRHDALRAPRATSPAPAATTASTGAAAKPTATAGTPPATRGPVTDFGTRK